MPEILYLITMVVGLAIGFFFGWERCRLLKQEMRSLRDDLQHRETLLRKHAAREDKMIKAMFEKVGAPLDDQQPNRVLDRSPRAVAEIVKRRKESETEWEGVTAGLETE